MAKSKKPEAFDTANLVDEIGSVTAIIADFAKKKKAMVKELLARAGNRHYIDGNLYTATIVAEHSVSTLDIESVKLEMGDDWVAAHSKEGVREASVRVTARKKPEQKKARAKEKESVS